MKKLITLSLMIVASFTLMLSTASAQNRGGGCVVDTASCVDGAIYGRACPPVLASATAGTNYSQSVTFAMPRNASIDAQALLGLPLGVIEVGVPDVVISVQGLPEGLSYRCDNGTCAYDTSRADYGCLEITGVPCDTGGLYDVVINFEAPVLDIAGLGPISLPIPINITLEMSLTSSLPNFEVTAPYTYLCTGGGAGSTGLAIAPAGYDTYLWSDGSTNDSLDITAPGDYSVTVTAFSGACSLNDTITFDTLSASTIADVTICANEFLPLSADGGDFFNWSPGAVVSDSTVANALVVGLTSTTTLTVETTNGFCTETASVEVTVNNSCAGPCGDCAVNVASCSGTTVGLCSTPPNAIAGATYEEEFTFFIPGTVSLLDVVPLDGLPLPPAQLEQTLQNLGIPTSFEVQEVTVNLIDLPTGYTWECDQVGSGCVYYPNLAEEAQYGCIKVCGDGCIDGGEYLNLELTFTLPQDFADLLALVPVIPGLNGNELTAPLPVDFNVVYDDSLTVSNAGSNAIAAGETRDLTALTGFTSYSWSTGETTQTITVNAAGTYTVTATDANGCQQEAQIILTVGVGINELTSLDQLKLFPNPTQGKFDISFNLVSSEAITLKVFNMTGEEVIAQVVNATSGANRIPVSLEGNAAGIYTVKLFTEEGMVTRNISVQ